MKVALFLAFAFARAVCPAQQIKDVVFTNMTTVTFTNLEGKRFEKVTLVRGDLDGIIWRSEASGGRVCYTNIAPDILGKWGISSNRVEIALARAQRKAVADAKYRAMVAAETAAKLSDYREEQARWAAGAPAREKEAQRQADLQRIEALRAQIEAAERRVRYADAVTPTGVAGDPAYVDAVMAQRANVNLAAEQVEDAKIQLRKMEKEFEAKYSGK